MQRRSAQTAIFEVLNMLARMIAPILVFTAEEIWQHMPKEKEYRQTLSVHILDWPSDKYTSVEEALDFRYVDEAIRLIPDVAKVLEELRGKGQIGSSFDAQINILTNTQDRYTFLQSFNVELCEIFKVSQVKVSFDKGNSVNLSVKAEKAEGSKCPRCWNYSLKLGSDPAHPLICDNCLKAIGGS
jgi:isoleucyl-tRNA synthetase